MRVEQREATAQLEAYAAIAAHQIGEAVALVRGGAAALLDPRERSTAPAAEAVRALEAGADRAQRFVDDLLDYRAAGRPGGGAASDLVAALEAATRVLAVDLQRAGAVVADGPLPAAPLSPEAARLLLVHLVRAALAAGAHRVEVVGEAADRAVSITVADDGAPLDDADAALEQLGHPRGRGPLVGAGLSLLIARRIAETAGGELALGVDASGRTRATVTLPAVGSS